MAMILGFIVVAVRFCCRSDSLQTLSSLRAAAANTRPEETERFQPWRCGCCSAAALTTSTASPLSSLVTRHSSADQTFGASVSCVLLCGYIRPLRHDYLETMYNIFCFSAVQINSGSTTSSSFTPFVMVEEMHS